MALAMTQAAGESGAGGLRSQSIDLASWLESLGRTLDLSVIFWTVALFLRLESLPSRRVGGFLRVRRFAMGNPFALEQQFPVPSSRLFVGI
jgi:hypothetical protein